MSDNIIVAQNPAGRNTNRLPPSTTTLRDARTALLDAIHDGADYLLPLLDEIEAALLEQLAARRHQEARSRP